MTTLPSARRVSFGALLLTLLVAAATPTAFAQSAVITGRVTSEAGNPLEVSNVFITEMRISVPANSDGRYAITIPSERVRGQTVTLRARAIGYASLSKPLTLAPGSYNIDFVLKRDINRLQEVVITGVTGATEIKKTAFSITSLDQADMPVPSTSVFTQLQAKVPGAQIVMPSGRPGTAPQVFMRGIKSLNAEGRSQAPLFIVDGIIVTQGSQDLNPQDIESVEVVKGAAASSVYGSRAGSGVIQITTKSGRNAAPGVKFSGRTEYGFSDVQGRYPFSTRHFLMLDETGTKFCIKQTGLPACSRVVDFEEEALRVNQQGGDFALAPYSFERDFGIGQSPTKAELKGLFMVNQWPKRYDPIEMAVTNGQFINSNVDATGRFGNTSYFASGSQLKEEGAIMFLNGYNRYSGRVNVDQQLGEAWSMLLSSFYSRSSQFADGEWFRLTRVPPGVNLLRRDDKGRLFIRSNPLQQGQQNENPLYDNEQRYRRTNADRYLGSMKTRYTPFEWLDLDATASIDRRRSNFFSMQDRGFRSTASSPANLGTARADNNADASYNLGLNGTAKHDFSPDLNTLFNVRYSYEQEDGWYARGDGDALALPGLRSLDAVTTNFNLDSDESSVRAVGMSAGGMTDYKGRYIFDALYRYDGSSLFGADERWHPYYRTSFAWRASEEPFWKWTTAVNDLKFRSSYGTAGGRPRFSAQYETFNIGTGGLVTAQNRGNRNLKPETTEEVEVGLDAELFNKYGLSLTYARDITKDQIILVPPPVASGFSNRWQNAGTLDGKSWELSLNVPIITSRSLVWSSRLGWDRSRTYITELGVPAFFQTNESSTFRYAVGERIGTIYGKRFVTSCAEFPAAFQAQCGPGKEWQPNDEGFIAWIGAGNTSKDGITKNLWQAVRPGCISSTGATINVVGEVDCRKQGGIVNNPWGQGETHWGMLTNVRDSTGSAVLLPLGNTLPDYRLTFSQTLQYKKLYLYALVDHSHGNKLMNEEIHWSLGDFMVDEEDQIGKSVENAKPVGYYWRATRPENGSGVGGFYDVLGANNHTVQSGQYTKIRELNVAYQLGQMRGIAGDWNIALIGRNLYTFSKFRGWDPEVGISGTNNGNLNSAGVQNVAAFQYPPRRTFTLSLGSKF
jgi:TonB-linked SusC/RagA family outer membrane protein